MGWASLQARWRHVCPHGATRTSLVHGSHARVSTRPCRTSVARPPGRRSFGAPGLSQGARSPAVPRSTSTGPSSTTDTGNSSGTQRPAAEVASTAAPSSGAVTREELASLAADLQFDQEEEANLLQSLTSLNVDDQRFTDILFPQSTDLLTNRRVTATLIDMLHDLPGTAGSSNSSSSSTQDSMGSKTGSPAEAGSSSSDLRQQGGVPPDSGAALNMQDVSSSQADGASVPVTVLMSGPQPEHQQPRTSGFCFNCCAPLDADVNQQEHCNVCGADPHSQHLLQPDPHAKDTAAAGAALTAARLAAAEAGVPGVAHTLLVYQQGGEEDAAMLQHRSLLPPAPERPERIGAILGQLRSAGLLDMCERLPVQEATDEELLAVHTQQLLDAVAGLETSPPTQLPAALQACVGEDMLGNRATHRAARQAAGSAAELARKLVFGLADSGMALLRPAGHLASAGLAEGGSYFNSAAVAARAAQALGAQRVMIIDWDVHHCKGTSSIFAEDPNVLVVSVHRYGNGYFPGTGAPEDTGTGAGRGRNVNVGWTPPLMRNRRGRLVPVDTEMPGDADYLLVWHNLVLPLAYEFEPELIIVSAGFDAADGDPMGQCHVTPACFGHLTALLRPVARLALLLEGGYNLEATAAGAEACLRALLGQRPRHLPGGRSPSIIGWNSLLRTLVAHQPHWSSLGMLQWLEMALPAAQKGSAGAAAGGTPAAAAVPVEEYEEYEEEEEEEEEEAALDAVEVWEGDEGEDEEVLVQGVKSKQQQQQAQQPLVQAVGGGATATTGFTAAPTAPAGPAAAAASTTTPSSSSGGSSSSNATAPVASSGEAPGPFKAGSTTELAEHMQQAVAAAELAARLLSQKEMALPMSEPAVTATSSSGAAQQQQAGVVASEAAAAPGQPSGNTAGLPGAAAVAAATSSNDTNRSTAGSSSSSSGGGTLQSAGAAAEGTTHTTPQGGTTAATSTGSSSSGSSKQQLSSVDGSLTIDMGPATPVGGGAPGQGVAGQPQLPADLARSTERIKEADGTW